MLVVLGHFEKWTKWKLNNFNLYLFTYPYVYLSLSGFDSVFLPKLRSDYVTPIIKIFSDSFLAF